ncbi:hypothetical protein [Paucibacter sp. KCTC 42545]|uniref:hypothetical protein n=1 Tax=Paucibacter sp. KCTC 42545 TaxID=1768242 RepID=UPI0012E3F585|nr:hypothetical protein [Paucibacter sp. KCTC 42545]
MSSHILPHWPRSQGQSQGQSRPQQGPGLRAVHHVDGPAHAGLWWWSGLAALLCLALLLALQVVVQRSVEQGQLRRAIKATQIGQARHCTQLVGGRQQEACLLALNESARLGAQAQQALPPVQASNP